MTVERRDPYRAFNFRVGIGGRSKAASGFSEVRFPTLLVRPDQPVDGHGFAHLVLKRGYTGSTELYEWWDQERKTVKPTRGRVVTVELLDDENKEVVTTWRFTGCRPVALDFSPLNALDSAVIAETITLTFDTADVT